MEAPAAASPSAPVAGVAIGEERFLSHKALSDRIHDILFTHKVHDNLAPTEFDLVLGLLKQGHPNAAAKIGSGAAGIKIITHPQHPDARCFALVRHDDSIEDFSYLKCVDVLFPDGAPHKTKGKRKILQFTPGFLVRFTVAESAHPSETPGGCESRGEIRAVTLKKCFIKHFGEGSLAYVEFKSRNNSGIIRFKEATAVTQALTTLAQKDFTFPELPNVIFQSAQLIEGEEEKQYYTRMEQRQQETRTKRFKGGQRGRGRGRGKRTKGTYQEQGTRS